MKKLKFVFIGFLLMILITGCKTIKQKTDDIVEKGVQYRSYYFHYEAIRLLRKIIQHQHEANATNKFENSFI